MIVAGETEAGAVFARSDAEVADLIDHIMTGLNQGGRTVEGFETPPEYGTLAIFEGEHPNEIEQRWPVSYLQVSVNTGNQYGALTWYTTRSPEGAGEDHPSRFVWISSNPNPPSFDPRLILDPGTPLYFPPEAALPVAQVREAAEEFCRVRTGTRPDCIQWMIDPNSLY
jgi:hypothetical protein